MTDPAITQAQPPRMIVMRDALLAGERLCVQEMDEQPSRHDVIWRLLEEATQCERHIFHPGPSEEKRHGIEYTHTFQELWAAAVGGDQELDGAHELPARPRPSSAAFSRFLEVTSWLRWVRAHKAKQRRRLIWRLAQGVPPQILIDSGRYGMATRKAIRAAKFRALENIDLGIDRLMKNNT